MSPLVDVIVATNRVGPHLAAAVASVREQDWSDWGLIVVDDGVPDPQFVPRTVADVPGAKVIRQANRGLSAARNVGVAASTADLLVFLDDDDVWDPTRLRRQVEALAAAPDAVGSYTGGWYMTAEGQPMGDGWPAMAGSIAQMRRLEVSLPRITTLMVRQRVLAAVDGFDESLPAVEDIDLTLRMLEHGEFVPVDAPLVGYRRHESNMTRTIPVVVLARLEERVFLARITAARAAGDHVAAADLAAGLARVRRATAGDLAGRLVVHLRERRPGLAVRDVVWSVSRSPLAVGAGVGRRVRRRLGVLRRGR